VSVLVTVGGERNATSVERFTLVADRRRDDIAALYAGVGPNHGLDSTVSTGKTGEQTVCAYALNTGLGQDTPLGCRTVEIVK
jgi:hypothetical protein